ncbi:MAG: phage tail tape measure protein [Mesorhizobium sp.]|uniref:phage tail tape measure protein n=1 Tax=Mesorhizobium sp. TaxID=1871066 RepID=UPI000FEA5ADF|nr:phage tail tape measure protein [Mesorhizobium sp.]RWC12364.1 MAG: phage tail tape measure protein [Mesorhizobium sp.]
MANVSTEQFIGGMTKLNKAITEAAKGTTKAGDAVDVAGVHVTRFGTAAKKTADSTKQTGTVFDQLGVKIFDASGKLRSNEAILLDVADAFARMPPSARKAALAVELFGKSGAELLPFLDQAKAGILDLSKQAEQLGIVLTQEQADIGDALGDSLDSVKKAVAGTRLQLGLLFAPGITALANGFADIINQNRQVLVEFADTINRKVLSVVGDLLHLLSGNTDNIKNPWIKDWSAAIIQFGSDVAGVFNGLILPAFKALRAGAQFVADQINKIFGTDITGGELALGAAVLSVVGAFTLLGSTIAAVVTGIGFLVGLVGGIPLAIAAAAVAAGVAIGVFWEDIKAGAAAAWQFITDGAAGTWQAIVDGATGLWESIVGAFNGGQQAAVDAFNGIVDSIVSAWNGLVDKLGAIAQQIVDRIAGWFGTLPQRITGAFDSLVSIASSVLNRISSLVDSIVSKIQSAINLAKQLVGLGSGDSGGSTQGFARGGYLAHGPGTGTSDSILARLSVGEFVIRAKVVKALGADFFHAINNGFLPSLDAFRSLSRGFSVGGLADGLTRGMAIPRFAAGGLASADLAPAGVGGLTGKLVHVDLQYGPSRNEVARMIAEDSVVDRLTRFAVGQSLTKA